MTAPAAKPGCALCGLACPDRFCCAGCENVYSILVESGVVPVGHDFRDTELYRESLRLGLVGQAVPPAQGRPNGLPHEFREALFHVSGMWCASCGWLIEHALRKQRGIVSAEVLFASDLLRVRYVPQALPIEDIPRRIARLGYQATEYTAERPADNAERRDLLLRTGVAAFVWLNVMTLSLVLYVGYFEQIAGEMARGIPYVLMALSAPAVFYSGWPVLSAAISGLRAGVLRMESLLAIGILAAYVYSAVQAFTGGRHFYFDTASAIVTLVLAGKLIERAAKEKTAQAVGMLYRMMPNKARLLQNGRERFVAIEALAGGMVYLVKTGERIPADGVVVEGGSHVDESVLTGESVPVPKSEGDQVVCGSLNIAGVLHVRATRVGSDSTLARVIAAVESALARRSQVERTVDRVARVFVPAVMTAALLTFAGWLASGSGAAAALMYGITVLVIACPCALGIATPLAITAAIGAASRRGILVSDARVLETVRKVDVVVLDKTGTVTEGKFRLLATAGNREHFKLAASLERYSEHPIGRAVERFALPGPARDVEVCKGMGILGTVAGRQVFAGNRALLARLSAVLPDSLAEQAQQWETNGLTVAFYGCDGAVTGAMALGDRIKEDAAGLVAELRRRGISTVLVSGDSRAATAAVAAQIGVDEFVSAALAEEKTRIVRDLQQRASVVAMVGDGVNDAASLAQADLGIALGSGADIAIQAAPLVILGASLHLVTDAFDLARLTLRVVKQNLFWAFAYNTAGIALAAAGVLNPIVAAAAMVLSSLSVIRNSLRIRP